jgi:hypothetical protein
VYLVDFMYWTQFNAVIRISSLFIALYTYFPVKYCIFYCFITIYVLYRFIIHGTGNLNIADCLWLVNGFIVNSVALVIYHQMKQIKYLNLGIASSYYVVFGDNYYNFGKS